MALPSPCLRADGYNRYLLLGSLVIAFLIAVPVFALVRWLVLRYRVSFATWVAGWRISAWLKGLRGTGLARRFLAGGEAKYERIAPPRGLFRYLRREGLVALPILYGICYLLAALIVPFFAGTLTTSSASWVVGSEVAVEQTSFNLFTGGLKLSDLSVQDPKQPIENLIEIPSVTLDVGMMPLLAKRVVFNRVVISDASLHVVREADGTLNIDNTVTAGAATGFDASGYIEWAAEHAKDVDWLGLLRRLGKSLRQLKLPVYGEDSYASYRGGRSFLGFRPPFAIERLEIGRVLVTLEDDFSHDDRAPLPPVTLLEVEISGLAFPTVLREEPIRVELRGQLGDDLESGFRLSATFESDEAVLRARFEFSMTRVDLARIARVYATTLPVAIQSGLATVEGSLVLDAGEASGVLSLLLEDLQLDALPGRPLLGLPAETSVRVLQGINRYAEGVPVVFATSIGGSSESPDIEWQAPLLEIAREGLLMTGERRFASTIEDLGLRIDALGGSDQALLDPDFAALQAQAEEAAWDLIEAAGSGLFDPPVIQDVLPSQTSSTAPIEDLLPALLRDLLHPPSEESTSP